ncbi:MAG: phospholipase D-like domain-containing protein [Deltaproteobacteria bacterium]
MTFLSWLSARLKSLFSAPPAAALPEPEPGPGPSPAPARVGAPGVRPDEPSTKRVARLERQLRAAEARAVDAAKDAKSAVGRAKEAEARALAAEQRARSVEAANSALERSAKRAAQTPDAGDAARASDLLARAVKADARVKDVEQKLADAQARVRETERLLHDAEAMVRAGPASPSKPAEVASRGGVADAHFSPGETCLQAIRSQFARAKKTADVCVFTITDDRIAASVLDAHRRGVKVRVITDNDKANDEGSDVARIARAGVAVRQDQSEYHMHHKFAVFDGRIMLTGSYNWTRGAANFNEENLVVTDEPGLVEAFTGEFESLWKKFAAS